MNVKLHGISLQLAKFLVSNLERYCIGHAMVTHLIIVNKEQWYKGCCPCDVFIEQILVDLYRCS